ncbi:MAG: 6-bladed beta-propeller [Bacteroidales bacterium]|nr:6-bladed beta-propeller [Bacteroidales bacterium]
MIRFFLLFSIVIAFASCDSKSKQNNNNIDTINISNVEVIDSYAIDYLLKDSIRAIALETNDDFVIGEISHIKYHNEEILICDKMSEAVYLYDANTGKAITKIHYPGRGPEEYIEIADADIYNDMVIIFDYVGSKLLIYSKEGEFIKAISTQDIWGEEILVINNVLYVINPDSETNIGFYHFFKLNNDDTFTPISNFNERDYGWGIDRFSCSNNSDLLFVLPPSDTIMLLGKNGAIPAYKVDFGRLKFSDDILEGNSLDVLKLARDSEQTKGIEAIYQLGNNIAFKYTNSTDNFYAIYNPKDSGIVISKRLFAHEVEIDNTLRTTNGVLLFYYPAYNMTDYFPNSSNKPESFISLAKQVDKEANPVVFIGEFK